MTNTVDERTINATVADGNRLHSELRMLEEGVAAYVALARGMPARGGALGAALRSGDLAGAMLIAKAWHDDCSDALTTARQEQARVAATAQAAALHEMRRVAAKRAFLPGPNGYNDREIADDWLAQLPDRCVAELTSAGDLRVRGSERLSPAARAALERLAPAIVAELQEREGRHLVISVGAPPAPQPASEGDAA